MTHIWRLLFLNLWLNVKADSIGIKTPDRDDRVQIMCTIALLRKYFKSGDDLSGSVLHMSITSASTYMQESLLQALHTDPIYPWTIVVENMPLGDREIELNAEHVLHEKPQCYFFVLENMEDVDMYEIFDNWKTNSNWNPIAQFVVLFSTAEETEQEMTDIMIEILFKFMAKKIYNVNVIGHNEEYEYYYGKTVFPYHPENNCGNRVISVEMLDICDYRESAEDEDNILKRKDEDDESGHDVEDEYEDRDNEQVEQQTTTPRSKFSPEIEIETPRGTELVNASENMTSKYTGFVGYIGNFTQFDYPKIYVEEIYRALFFDKFPKDLSGCPLVAAFRPWEPYIFYEALDNSLHTISTDHEEHNETQIDQDSGDSEVYVIYSKKRDIQEKAPPKTRLNGIEYKMIQTIADRLHINIVMKVKDNNLYHLFQHLLDEDVEMVVGGIDEDPNISQFVSSTIPYHQDDLTLCVARAQQTHNLFNFMATFKIGAWLLTLLFVFTASSSIFLSQQYVKVPLGFLKSYFRITVQVMAIILNQSIGLRPIPTSLKLCFGTTFFMGLIFSNVYQSFLISTLTTPKTSYQISHLNEIYQNRMHIVGSVENVRHLNKEGEIYGYVREQFHMCYNIEECLQHAAKDSNLAVIVARQHFLYNPRIPHDRLYCFDTNENINNCLVTILMPKKFHLLHKINPIIQHIIESGHLQKWARDLDMRRKISEKMQHARERQLKSLKLSQVAGSFAFHGILLVFVSLIFLMECLVHFMVVRRGTRLKLAKYLHRKLI